MPLLVDAEETWLQPAIDYLSLSFMPEYNKKKAIIYNTYQLYLKDALPRLRVDLGDEEREKDIHSFHSNILSDRAKTMGFKFGAKLVRGAYMSGGVLFVCLFM